MTLVAVVVAVVVGALFGLASARHSAVALSLGVLGLLLLAATVNGAVIDSKCPPGGNVGEVCTAGLALLHLSAAPYGFVALVIVGGSGLLTEYLLRPKTDSG